MCIRDSLCEALERLRHALGFRLEAAADGLPQLFEELLDLGPTLLLDGGSDSVE